jgi:hypothetical protein
MTQSIEYVVKVNAAQASAAISDIERRFGGVDTVVGRVDRSIVELERDIKDLTAAIAQGGPNAQHYAKALKELESASNRATGGKNVGGGILQLSQTLDDLQYGIRGVVNNIPGLVTGLGLGMGVAGVAQLAFIAVNQLTDKITGYIKKQQDATQAAIKYRNALLDVRIALGQTREALEGQLAVNEAQMTGRNPMEREQIAAIKTAEVERKTIFERQQNAKQQLEQLVQLGRERAAQNKYQANALDNLNEGERKRFDAAKRQVEQTKIEVEELDKSLALRLKIIQTQDKISKQDAMAPKADKIDGQVAEIFLETEDKMLEWVAKVRAEAIKLRIDEEKEAARIAEKEWQKGLREIEKAQRDSDRERARAEKKALREREREHEKTMRAIRDAEKKTADYQIGLASMTTDALTSTLADYISAKIEGEEYAEQKAVAAFLSSTGQQLIASGVRGVFEGAILSANPLTPGAGAGMIATGAVAIAAGAAMTGGGAAVTASIPSEASSPTSSTRDPGASPRSSGGGSGSGGPMIINVAYGAGGPLPEDLAREIARAVDSGDRRRGAA